MRPFIVLLALVLFLSDCVTTVEVNSYPNAGRPETPGFYNDTQKWERIHARFGSVQYLSRGDILQGHAQSNAAGVIQRRLGRGWVCRQKRQYGVVVVYCARHHKLQRYVPYNNAEAFHMELQPLLRWGAAPVYIDWGW